MRELIVITTVCLLMLGMFTIGRYTAFRDISGSKVFRYYGINYYEEGQWRHTAEKDLKDAGLK